MEDENPAKKFKKKSPPPKKSSDKKKKPKKSSKNKVPMKSTTHPESEIETMDDETTGSTQTPNPPTLPVSEPTTETRATSRETLTVEATTATETMGRRTPPTPVKKATPMKRIRSNSNSPDFATVLKKRLTDDEGFTLVTRKKTPERNKPTATQHTEKPKAKHPRPLVAEGTMLNECTSPTEVGKILNLGNTYKISRTKAGTFLIYAPDEKTRETIKRTTTEITIRDTRATSNNKHFPVIKKKIPTSWNMSDLEEKHPIRRLMSAKTGNSINKVKVLCPDADTQTKYLERGIIVDKERFRCEPFKPAKEPTKCFKCQSFGHDKGMRCKSDVCHHCSESHRSKDCKDANKKCANCKGDRP